MASNVLMNNTLYLILDQGGHSSRALIFDDTGQLHGAGRCSVDSRRPRPGYVEQDPPALVQSLRDAAAQAMAQLSDGAAARVACAGLVTQRSSMVCWRRGSGQPLTPVLSWQDTRAAEWLASLAFDREWLRQKTGLVANAHYGASKIRWCLDQIPAVEMAHASGDLVCASLAAFLAQALTGSREVAVDPGNGSRTLLLNCNSLRWDSELLQLFGIPADVLPVLRPTLHAYGELNIGDRRIPLQLVNGDQCSAFFANGDLYPTAAYINAGTGAFIAHTLDPSPGAVASGLPPGLLKTPVVCQADSCRFVCEGTVNGAADALDFGARALGLGQYRELDRWWAQQAELQAPMPLFLNGIGGLGSPFWRPDFNSQFVFADISEDACDNELKMLAILESIVFLLAVNLEIMVRHGMPVDRLVVSGGVSAFGAFCQSLADLSGLPVFRPDTVEATARGAAFQLLSARPKGIDRWRPDSGVTFCSEDDPSGEHRSSAIRRRYRLWRLRMPPIPSA